MDNKLERIIRPYQSGNTREKFWHFCSHSEKCEEIHTKNYNKIRIKAIQHAILIEIHSTHGLAQDPMPASNKGLSCAATGKAARDMLTMTDCDWDDVVLLMVQKWGPFISIRLPLWTERIGDFRSMTTTFLSSTLFCCCIQ